jgi:hypothetical protein
MMFQDIFDLRGVLGDWHAQGVMEGSHCLYGRYSDSGLLWPSHSVVLPLDTHSDVGTLLEAIPAR